MLKARKIGDVLVDIKEMGQRISAKGAACFWEKVMVELAPLVGGALSTNSGYKSYRPANHLNVK
jgi:hypothetical protein